MYTLLLNTIQQLQFKTISTNGRLNILQPLIDFIQQKVNNRQEINLNFICTHNSRRSHLCQIWAQVAASYFGIGGVNCYSGGTEETALFLQVAQTLSNQGFQLFQIATGRNPVYAIKYDNNIAPIIGFSKKYNCAFNPSTAFAAVITCSQADDNCPLIAGTEKRIPIPYEDPKLSDNGPDQATVYAERSLQIAREMFYVFSKINP